LVIELDRFAGRTKPGRSLALRAGNSQATNSLVEARLGSRAAGYTRTVPTKDEVIEALHAVEDPELGMDIVELGLLYDVEVEGPKVKVIHSLTSMGCPAGPMIQEDIQSVASQVPGVENVEIELTWDPPWTPDRMSDDAKFILGFG
jgi:metal-sulfur cluster biosynthetic enzyme